MNTSQILGLLNSDQALRQICNGVCPIDCLPTCETVPAALVVNLDKQNESGSHWVALYFDKNHKCDYFDSYGLEPNQTILEYITENSSSYKWNKKCVQQYLTATCGQLCVYFLLWRVRGIAMNQIVGSLAQSYADEYVTGFINDLFQTNTVVYDENFILDQISQTYKS